MPISKSQFTRGIIIRADDVGVESIEGELKVSLASKRLQIYLDGALRTVVTQNQVQTLTNKDIDLDNNTLTNLETDNLKSGVLNTSTTLATASDVQIPSALAVKTYVDNKAAAQNEASEISVSAIPGRTGANVQAVLEELDTELDSTTAGLAAHLADAIDSHDASAISNIPAGNLAATDLQSAVNELQSDIDTSNSNLAAHIADTTDAHAASAITNTPAGNLAAVTVQAALNELQSDIDTSNTNLTNHINDTTDAHAGSAITNTPSGNLAAITVQAALNELQTDVDTRATSAALSAEISRATIAEALVQTNLDNHLADAIDAHDASAISNIPSGNLAATDQQAANNELQTDIDTRATSAALSSEISRATTAEALVQTNLTTHINNATGAHAGTAISNTPSGNLAATTVQAALNELQSDIDTRATSSALASHEADTTAIHGIADTSLLVTTTGTQTLSNKTFSDAVGLPELGATPTNPSAGSQKIYMKADGKFYKLTSAGVETEVGSGSGTGGTTDVDILAVQTFNTAVVGDFTQTGLTFNTTNPIQGIQSAQLIHQAAINQSFKQPLAVDRKFRNQLVELSLNVRSTATTGNLTLLVTDETNATTIAASQSIATQSFAITATTAISTTLSGISNTDINLLSVGMAVSGPGIQTSTVINSINTAAGTAVLSLAATAAATVSLRISTLPITRTFSFTVPSNCLSMSYTVTALPEANLPRSTVDDVVLKLASVSLLETSVTVPTISTWAAYTPTFTGFGTPSATSFYWRQVGSNIEIEGRFIAGTTTAVEGRVSLPNGYTSSSQISTLETAGTMEVSIGSASYFGPAVLIEPSVTYLTFGIRGSGSGALSAKANGSSILSTGATASFVVSIPITGLSATTTTAIPLTQAGIITNPDSTIRVDTANGFGSTNTKIRRFTNVRQAVGSDITFSDSATLGSYFTVNSAGTYSFSYSENFSAAAAMGLSLNSTQLTTDVTTITDTDRLAIETSDTAGRSISCSWSGYLNAGDVIRAHTQGQAATTNNQVAFTASKQNSLKQVTVNTNSKITIPTSELRFEGSSSRGSTATAIVRFDTQAKIRGDAFTVTNTAADGTFVTMLKAGRLNMSASVYPSAAATLYLTRNQTTLTGNPTASETLAAQYGNALGYINNVAWEGDVVVGDVLRVGSNAGVSAYFANSFNLSFQEQDIQVSVSNTLPQFSESDSCVRLDTANGYGSTNTKIRRFSNVRDNTGTDIVYTDDSVLGSSFRIVKDGLYSISYSDGMSSVSYIGLTKNTSSGSTNVSGLATAPGTTSEVLAITILSTAGGVAHVSYSGYFLAGDVIRPHSDGIAASDNDWTKFTMSKVGRPNVTGVNVTSFVELPMTNVTAWENYVPTFTGFGTVSTSNLKYRQVGDSVEIRGTFVSGTSTAVEARVSLPNNYVSSSNIATLEMCGSIGNSSVTGRFISTLIEPSVSYLTMSLYDPGTAALATKANGNGITSSGNTVNIVARVPIAGLSLYTSNVITPVESFSTDTASLTYASSAAYTLTTLSTAPVGTFITFTYGASGNVRTQTTTAPTQTTADMSTNGVRMYARAFDEATTAALPASVAIQIGKGFKGLDLALFKTTGKATRGSIDYVLSGTVKQGLSFKNYDATTGILYLDSKYDRGTNSQAAGTMFIFDDLVEQDDGYVVINASKSPALTGINSNLNLIRAVNTSGTSIANTGDTKLALDSSLTIVRNMTTDTANNRILAPVTGVYQVSAAVQFSAQLYAAGNAAELRLYKNGVYYSTMGRMLTEVAASQSIGISGSDSISLAIGDYVEIFLNNNRTAGATALITTAGANFVNVTKLGGIN